MRSKTHDLTISTGRVNALFASTLQRSEQPSTEQVQQAIAAAVRAYGIQGCAARVAQAYGDHPETALLRMRWARAVVNDTSGSARPQMAYVPGARPSHRSGICRAA